MIEVFSAGDGLKFPRTLTVPGDCIQVTWCGWVGVFMCLQVGCVVLDL